MQPEGVPNARTFSAYERHKTAAAERQAQQSRAGRDIGDLPPVVDPDRKASCERDLRRYLETYHAPLFHLGWSDDHLRIIRKIEQAVLIGGFQALAMPRGSGKTTICTRAVLWAALYGHHRYTLLIAANDGKAAEGLEALQLEIETNPQLAEDFPEVCYPIRRLERIAQRARGQLHHGEPTHIQWTGDKLILPTIPDSKAAGAVIGAAGLQAAVRGALLFHPATLQNIRPTFALLDDPQTRESARSEDETDKRERIIKADVRGLAGPGQSFSALATMTVIEAGDLADRLLNHEKNPEWRGERTQMLRTMPENLELWEEYWQIVRRVMAEAEHQETKSPDELWAEPNAFYKTHRRGMEKGAEVSWTDRKLPHELSAIQHAMNLWLSDPETFDSEYQNAPQLAGDDEEEFLPRDEIAARLSGHARGQIPGGAHWITAFIDVHLRILYWSLCAWEPDFTGYAISYGVFPKQRHPLWTARRARPTLKETFPKAGTDGAIYRGLEALADDLFGRTFTRDDGAEMHLDGLLVDAGWKTDLVVKWSQQSKHKGRIIPSFGRVRGPHERPISTYKPRRGERIGEEWNQPASTGRAVRHVTFDANYWKTHFHRRLATSIGDPGAFTLFGESRHAVNHEFVARHLTAEYRQTVTGKFRVDEWKMKPGESENHWLDCMVGASVAASMLGAKTIPKKKPPAKRGQKQAQWM